MLCHSEGHGISAIPDAMPLNLQLINRILIPSAMLSRCRTDKLDGWWKAVLDPTSLGLLLVLSFQELRRL